MPKRRKRDTGLGNKRPNKTIKNVRIRRVNNNTSSYVSPTNNVANNSTITNNNEPSSNDSVAVESVAVESVAMSDVISPNENVEFDTQNHSATGNYHKICAVALLFEKKYDGLTKGIDEETWGGRNGIISKIKDDLGLKVWSRSDFAPIFRHVLECARTGTRFEVKDLERGPVGRPPVIDIKSPSAQIIADCVESGLSIKRACYVLNEHLFENNEQTVGESAVHYLIKRLKPKVSIVKKRKQGSTDPNHKWSRIRFGFCKQLLVRFGVLEFPNDRPCFQRENAGPLELSQIVW